MAGPSTPITYQSTRLGAGRHACPGPVVCVMELASMLAGERFSDRPASVCPMIGALLRAYNDLIDDHRREDLYRYAAEAVGTRAHPRLQRRRAEVALAWAKSARAQRERSRWALRRQPAEPGPEDGPDLIAFYVITSIGRKHSDASHASLLAMLDRLIAMGVEERLEASANLMPLAAELIVGDLVEELPHTVQDAGRGQQLLVAELG